MARHPEIAAIVDALVGTWEGEGTGGYPTIDVFEYREITTITARDDHPALHYEQRTWKASQFGDVASHWESGLLRVSSDGTATMNNAQGGRVETMSGTWERTDSGWVIDLRSSGYAGDDRVIESTRSIRIDADSMAYVHEMKTTATNEMSPHLKARLERSKS